MAMDLMINKDQLPQHVLERFSIEKTVSVELTFGASTGGYQAGPVLIGYRIKIDGREFLKAALNDRRLKVERIENGPHHEDKSEAGSGLPTAQDLRDILEGFEGRDLGDQLAALLKRVHLHEHGTCGGDELVGAGWLPTGMSPDSPSSERIGGLISAIATAVTSSFEGLCYVPPLRDLPARYFDLSGADASWQRLFDEPRLLEKINGWLDSEQFRTKYELVISEYFSRGSLEKKLPALLMNVYGNRSFDLHPQASDRFGDVSSFVRELQDVLGDLEEEFKKLDLDQLEELVRSEPDLTERAAGIAYDLNLNGVDEETFLEHYGKFTSRSLQEMGEEEGMSFFRQHWDGVSLEGLFDFQAYDENSDHSFHSGVAAFRAWAMKQPKVIELIKRYFDPVESAKRFLDQQVKSGSNVRREILLRDKKHQTEVSLQDVGVGISQVLPVVLHAFGEKEKLIAIEQPEIHIHPALQSELGDAFIESALGDNKNTFVLETHSEHLILRLLRRIRETTESDFSSWSDSLKLACPKGIKPEDIAVLYVQPGEQGATVIQLPLTDDGDFSHPWPGGFFAERSKELF